MAHDPAPRDARERAFLDKAASAIRVVRFTRRLHPDSAASRAYYAVHNAMNGRCETGLPRDHGQLVQKEVLQRAGLDGTDGVALQELYNARRMADYGKRRTESADAEILMLHAEELLGKLGVDFG